MLDGIITAQDFRDLNGNSMMTTDKLKIKGNVVEANTVVAGSVRSDWIYAGSIYAGQINGGVANLSTNVNIGNTYSYESKNLNFYNGSGASNISLQTDKSLMIANGSGDLYLYAKIDTGIIQTIGNILAIQNTTTNINSTTLNLNSSVINFGGATVTGLNVTPKFA